MWKENLLKELCKKFTPHPLLKSYDFYTLRCG